jgi:hypothetical protein
MAPVSQRAPTSAVQVGFTNWFVNNQSPSNRVSVCEPAGRVDPIDSPPGHPMQTLYLDLKKRREVQDFAEICFARAPISAPTKFCPRRMQKGFRHIDQ